MAAAFAFSGAPAQPDKPVCHSQQFPKLSERIWDPSRWRREAPKPKAVAAAHRIIGCAKHPGPLKAKWRADKARFYEHRKSMLWLEKYKPFIYPSGKRWAAPYPVALCESGENYFVGPAGAYGLILAPSYMSPQQQDEEAYRLLHTVGAEQAWFRWEREQGCPYI